MNGIKIAYFVSGILRPFANTGYIMIVGRPWAQNLHCVFWVKSVKENKRISKGIVKLRNTNR